jgi:hypothetical protein
MARLCARLGSISASTADGPRAPAESRRTTPFLAAAACGSRARASQTARSDGGPRATGLGRGVLEELLEGGRVERGDAGPVLAAEPGPQRVLHRLPDPPPRQAHKCQAGRARGGGGPAGRAWSTPAGGASTSSGCRRAGRDRGLPAAAAPEARRPCHDLYPCRHPCHWPQPRPLETRPVSPAVRRVGSRRASGRGCVAAACPGRGRVSDHTRGVAERSQGGTWCAGRPSSWRGRPAPRAGSRGPGRRWRSSSRWRWISHWTSSWHAERNRQAVRPGY